MTRTTTKCSFPKCRNVGRSEWKLVSEDGAEDLGTVTGLSLICRKHLLETIVEGVERMVTELDVHE